MITDRNGILLATQVKQYRLGIDPSEVWAPAETAARLVSLFPELEFESLTQKLSAQDKKYVLLKPSISPAQRQALFEEPLPGLHVEEYERRFYPKAPLAAHILGFVNRDGKGVSGVERAQQYRLASDPEPVALTLDTRVQIIVEEALQNAMYKFHAPAAAGMVMNVQSGELLAMASLPHFDANQPITSLLDPLQAAGKSDIDQRNALSLNRLVAANYELGSVFKLFSLITALENKEIAQDALINVREPLRMGGYQIRDDHPLGRDLSLEEVLVHSSNVGAARLALASGTSAQQEILNRFGMLTKPEVGLKETVPPLIPKRWQDIETVTLSYGYGLAVTPVQLARAYAVIANEGREVHPRIILSDLSKSQTTSSQRLVSPEIARRLQKMLYHVVENGTASKAKFPGLSIAGKTGTAVMHGSEGYDDQRLVTNFVAFFPAERPRYLVYVLLENPSGIEETFGLANSGWNAAPLGGEIIARIAPLLTNGDS